MGVIDSQIGLSGDEKMIQNRIIQILINNYSIKAPTKNELEFEASQYSRSEEFEKHPSDNKKLLAKAFVDGALWREMFDKK
jgi:hypothetical protein